MIKISNYIIPVERFPFYSMERFNAFQFPYIYYNIYYMSTKSQEYECNHIIQCKSWYRMFYIRSTLMRKYTKENVRVRTKHNKIFICTNSVPTCKDSHEVYIINKRYIKYNTCEKYFS